MVIRHSGRSAKRSIYSIRDRRVMLDRDVARLYGVETKVLNRAVRRNIKRFPAGFMFSLTREEIKNISPIVTKPGIKAPNVFAFTIEGLIMLSSVLHTKQAIAVNMYIIRSLHAMKTPAEK